MGPTMSEEPDETREQLNIGGMIGIALSAVMGTTLTIWAFHFLHMNGSGTATIKPFPRIAVLPFHSLSAAKEEIASDRALTDSMISCLAHVARVEALPPETDTDPEAVGRELGVKMLLIGKIDREARRVHVNLQLVSAQNGKQIWAGTFEGDSNNPAGLSEQMNKALAPHLTGLLD